MQQYLRKNAQFIKFCLVGVVNTVADVLTYALLHQLLGLSSLLASTITTFSVVIISYLANSLFVFKKDLDLRTFGKFILTTCLGIVVIQGVLTSLLESPIQGIVKDLLGDTARDIFIANSITRIAGTAFSLAWNYLFYKYLVFAIKSRANRSNSENIDQEQI